MEAAKSLTSDLYHSCALVFENVLNYIGLFFSSQFKSTPGATFMGLMRLNLT